MNCTTISNSNYETGDSSTSLSPSSCRSERYSDSSLFKTILCSVPLIIVILMCAMLRNFDLLGRIIGLNLENNQKTFQEVRSRILGKILSIIASSLTLRHNSYNNGGYDGVE